MDREGPCMIPFFRKVTSANQAHPNSVCPSCVHPPTHLQEPLSEDVAVLCVEPQSQTRNCICNGKGTRKAKKSNPERYSGVRKKFSCDRMLHAVSVVIVIILLSSGFIEGYVTVIDPDKSAGGNNYPVFPMCKWQSFDAAPVESHRYKLLNLMDNSLFNVCNLQALDNVTIIPLLQSYNLSSGDSYALFVDKFAITQGNLCPSLDTAYLLPEYLAYKAIRSGAGAVIMSIVFKHPFRAYFASLSDHIDYDSGVVETVSIGNRALVFGMRKEDTSELRRALVANNGSLLVDVFSDYNEVDAIVYNPRAFTQYIFVFLAFLPAMMVLATPVFIYFDFKFNAVASIRNVLYRGFILVLIGSGNTLTAISIADPLGSYGRVGTDVSCSVLVFIFVFSFCTFTCLFLLWLDLIYAYRSSFKRIPFFMQSRWSQVVVIVIAITALIILIVINAKLTSTFTVKYGVFKDVAVRSLFNYIIPAVITNIIGVFPVAITSFLYIACKRNRDLSTAGTEQARLFKYRVSTVAQYFLIAAVSKFVTIFAVLQLNSYGALDTWPIYLCVILSVYLPEVTCSFLHLRILFLLIFPLTSILERDIASVRTSLDPLSGHRITLGVGVGAGRGSPRIGSRHLQPSTMTQVPHNNIINVNTGGDHHTAVMMMQRTNNITDLHISVGPEK